LSTIENRENWITVFVTEDHTEAELVRGLLENGDIPVAVRSSRLSPFPVNVGELGRVELLVPVTDKERAEEIIRDTLDT